MKNKILISKSSYLLILAFCFTLVKSSNQTDFNSELISKKNMVNNQIIFYLNQTGTIKDSLILNDLNFGIDTLIKVKNDLWSYIYSVRCGSGCKLRKQVLIIGDHEKLRLSYVGYSSSSYDYRDLYSNNLNIKGSINVSPYPIYNCFYTFTDSLTSKNLIIKEYIYKGKIPDDGTKGTSIYYQLKYDSLKKVYYTQTQLLSGTFTIVASKNNKESKRKINTVVLALKFKEIKWVYLDNTWYELNQKGNFLIKFE
jgi:hypothetical protein